MHLRMLLDRTSIEVFGNQGRVYLPLCIPEQRKETNWIMNCSTRCIACVIAAFATEVSGQQPSPGKSVSKASPVPRFH
jgi:hypothetical protein